jgi:UPF0755 protein
VFAGQSKTEIAQSLKNKDLIKSKWAFIYYSVSHNKSLKPGIYYLKQNMNTLEIIDLIASGKVQEHKITTIEGWRNSEIADYLIKNSIITNKEAFLKAANGKEGYLFPDTYRLSLDVTPEEIVKLMTDNYNKRTNDLNVSKDDLILASIIERESANDEQRYNVSGVYKNRMKIGMKLESSPTVSYAKNNWVEPTITDTKLIDSPYNTYKYAGFPPGPICSPGLASIKAAQKPATHDYYYFINTKDGQLIMAKTLNEHNANVSKYLK